MERLDYILIYIYTTYAFVQATPSIDDINYLNVFQENHDLVTQLSLDFCHDAHFRLQLMYKAEIKIANEVLQLLNKSTHKTDLNEEIEQTFIKIKDKHNDEIEYSNFLHHPLNVLKFFRRIWDQFNPMINKLSTLLNESTSYLEIYKIIFKNLKRRNLQCWLRNKQDISSSIHSLVQLIWAYKIPVDQFAQGNIFGHQSVEPLPLRDLIQIMDHAFKSKLYQISKDMGLFLIKEKLEMMKDITDLEQKVYRLTAHSYHRTGYIQKANELCKKYLFEHPNDPLILKDISLFEMNKTYRIEEASLKESILNKYHDLCRGSDLQKPKGFCIYRRPLNGWYLVKEEIVSVDPYIAQFYDIIHDKEINALIKQGKKYMSKSTIFSRPNEQEPVENKRLSQTSWIEDLDHPIAQQLAQRIGFITQLNVAHPPDSNSEMFQIVNYGFGGMFKPHYDILASSRFENESITYHEGYLSERGDRLATWMFYLSDVAVGGGTAFVDANVTVPAVKGSSAFWYNILEDGRRDLRSLHGGCPVLIGEKWISNKWINEDNQLFTRPCLLQPN